MKKFEFKLQPVLSYRGYQERIAQQNTAMASMAVKECEQQIVQLKQTYDQSAGEIEKMVIKGVSASEFRRHHYYMDMVENSIKDEESRRIQLKKELREKLLELKKKSVDKKIMELYREKLKTEYTQEVLKTEQKESDEMTSIKTARALSR